ncbi:MAG TPA: flagellar biosynthesis anti-sigma factor FlgM [Burkholderiaceae bacterium]
MKITDVAKGLPTPAPAIPAGQAQAQANSARGAEKSVVIPPAADSVRLSTASVELERRIGGASAVFDTKKVERIKLAIADGQFNVNSEKVADGLLETVRDLLHSRKR